VQAFCWPCFALQAAGFCALTFMPRFAWDLPDDQSDISQYHHSVVGAPAALIQIGCCTFESIASTPQRRSLSPETSRSLQNGMRWVSSPVPAKKASVSECVKPPSSPPHVHRALASPPPSKLHPSEGAADHPRLLGTEVKRDRRQDVLSQTATPAKASSHRLPPRARRETEPDIGALSRTQRVYTKRTAHDRQFNLHSNGAVSDGDEQAALVKDGGRDRGLSPSVASSEAKLQVERTDGVVQEHIWNELHKSKQREFELAKELESMKKSALYEHRKRRAAEMDLERCRRDLERYQMAAEDMRRVEATVSGNGLCPTTPSSSPSALSLLPSSSASAHSLQSEAGASGGGSKTPEKSIHSARKDKFGMSVSTDASAQQPRVFCQAESLVLEMFSSEPSSVRSAQVRSRRNSSRSPSSKEIDRQKDPSPSGSSRSNASVQTEPARFSSHDPTKLPLKTHAEKPAMLLALNGCMPSFPSAELSPKIFDISNRRGRGSNSNSRLNLAASASHIEVPEEAVQQPLAIATEDVPTPAVLPSQCPPPQPALSPPSQNRCERSASSPSGSEHAGVALAKQVATAMGSPEPWTATLRLQSAGSRDCIPAAHALGGRAAKLRGEGHADSSPPSPPKGGGHPLRTPPQTSASCRSPPPKRGGGTCVSQPVHGRDKQKGWSP